MKVNIMGIVGTSWKRRKQRGEEAAQWERGIATKCRETLAQWWQWLQLVSLCCCSSDDATMK